MPGLASVPFVTQRVIWPGMASGQCAVVFSELSKLLNQEYALGAPPAYAIISALSRAAPGGRRYAADRRDPSLLMCH